MSSPRRDSALPITAATSVSVPGPRSTLEAASLVDRDHRIVVLADGFGGPGSGDVAAKLACDSIQNFLVKEAGDLEATLPFVLRSYFSLAGNVLFNALIHANRKLFGANRGKGANERGGASAIAAFVDGDLLALASVGGCSAWLLRPEGAELRRSRLVTPRTYSALVDPRVTDGGHAPFGTRVPLAALGMAEDLEPEIIETRVRPGDILLLHAGEWSTTVIDAIAREASNELPARQAEKVTELVRSAKFSDDSASYVWVWF